MDSASESLYFSRSQYFLIICLAVMGGIFLASGGEISLFFSGIVLILGIGVCAVVRSPQGILLGLVASACALGMLWTIARERAPEYRVLALRYNGSFIQEEGIVDREVRGGSGGQKLVIRLGEAWRGMHVLLNAPVYPAVSYGDRISFEGILRVPAFKEEDDFDYGKYLEKDEIYATVDRPKIVLKSSGNGPYVTQKLLTAKHRFISHLDQLIGEPHASLLRGILLGEDLGDKTLRDDFTRTGLIHITALSGSNITLIAVFLSYITNWLVVPRRIAFSINTLLIVLFTIMVGAPASVVRAAVMGVLVLIARQVGRASTALYAVVVAGLFMALANPLLLRFDIGFQLSFLATLSLIYLGPIIGLTLRKFLPNAPLLEEYLAATLAAQMGTMPLVLYTFGVTSLIAPIANLLILPLIPLLMFLGFIVGLGGFIIPVVMRSTALLAIPLLGYVLAVVHALAQVPFATISWGKGSSILLGILGGVLGWIIVVFVRSGRMRWYGALEYTK